MDGSSSERISGERPIAMPMNSAGRVPSAKSVATRCMLIPTWPNHSPDWASFSQTPKIVEGAG